MKFVHLIMQAVSLGAVLFAGVSPQGVVSAASVAASFPVDRPAASGENPGMDGIWAGASAVNITPYTKPGDPNSNGDPDWKGGITPTGIWGEMYVDLNRNGVYDPGEPFVDDPGNTLLDPDSAGKYDGIYLAGFGQNRMATGVYDPIWARTIVMATAKRTIAWVSLDLIGYFSQHLDTVKTYLHAADPSVRVDTIILSVTHNHEAPDSIGIWGAQTWNDGKYPQYIDYVDHKIAQSIAAAYHHLQPVAVTFGAVTPQQYPDLQGLQSRNSCRTPWFFDDELRVMQLNHRTTGKTVATLINWSTHVESMEGNNTKITSDFVHTVRTTLEQKYGGVAVYVPGDQGAVEIVGDSCTSRWHRDTFDGQTFPVGRDGRPLAYTISRTYAIGRVVGKAAIYALEHGEVEPDAKRLDLQQKTISIPVTNRALEALAVAGVIDVKSYFRGREVPLALGTDLKTTIYALQIGNASFISAPGEMFPEIVYGLESHHRADIAKTDTGRPFEPAVRPNQPGKYKFFIGYTPDLFGYIVPGYDFYIYGAPVVTGFGLGAVVGEVRDPDWQTPPDPEYPDALYMVHYHETNSASSMLAPAIACTENELLGVDVSGNPACREWSSYAAPAGVHNPLRGATLPDAGIPDIGEPGSYDPNSLLVTHQ